MVVGGIPFHQHKWKTKEVNDSFRGKLSKLFEFKMGYYMLRYMWSAQVRSDQIRSGQVKLGQRKYCYPKIDTTSIVLSELMLNIHQL